MYSGLPKLLKRKRKFHLIHLNWVWGISGFLENVCFTSGVWQVAIQDKIHSSCNHSKYLQLFWVNSIIIITSFSSLFLSIHHSAWSLFFLCFLTLEIKGLSLIWFNTSFVTCFSFSSPSWLIPSLLHLWLVKTFPVYNTPC